VSITSLGRHVGTPAAVPACFEGFSRSWEGGGRLLPGACPGLFYTVFCLFRLFWQPEWPAPDADLGFLAAVLRGSGGGNWRRSPASLPSFGQKRCLL